VKIFVDTGGWFALIWEKDVHHGETKKLFAKNRPTLITTDYVMDETVTLLQSRVGHAFSLRFLDMLHKSQNARLVFLSEEHITKTIELFRGRPDKGWSFTDCSSFVLMKNYGIRYALAFDRHFQQAGFETIP
jgi:predicted nucleic acid-binding protein